MSLRSLCATPAIPTARASGARRVRHGELAFGDRVMRLSLRELRRAGAHIPPRMVTADWLGAEDIEFVRRSVVGQSSFARAQGTKPNYQGTGFSRPYPMALKRDPAGLFPMTTHETDARNFRDAKRERPEEFPPAQTHYKRPLRQSGMRQGALIKRKWSFVRTTVDARIIRAVLVLKDVLAVCVLTCHTSRLPSDSAISGHEMGQSLHRDWAISGSLGCFGVTAVGGNCALRMSVTCRSVSTLRC